MMVVDIPNPYLLPTTTDSVDTSAEIHTAKNMEVDRLVTQPAECV